MAKPAAKAPAKAPPRPAKGAAPAKPPMGSGQLILWAMGLVGIMFVFTGSFLLLLVGMAPTLVAYLIDRTPKKFAAWCVGGMNFAGVLPSMLTYWDKGESVRKSISVAFNPFDLTVMYGAAAFGWMLYQSIPPVVAAMIAVSAQHRIAKLRARQRELIKEWGEALALAPKEN